MSRSDAPALLSPSYASPDVSAPSPSTATTLNSSPRRSRPAAMPKRGGDRGCRVTGAEHVVLALDPLQKAGEPAFLPQRLEPAVATREQLVRVALVADVPDELIARRVEDVVQRDRQLHDAEPRADVSAGARADVDEPRAHLGGQRRAARRGSAPSDRPRTEFDREESCVGRGGLPHLRRAAHERRATTYCAIDSSGGVSKCASRNADVASSMSAAARCLAPSVPSNAG